MRRVPILEISTATSSGLTLLRSVRATPNPTFGIQHTGKCAAEVPDPADNGLCMTYGRREDRTLHRDRCRRRVGGASSSEDSSALKAASQSASAACRQDVGCGLRKPFAPTSVTDSTLSARRGRDVGELRRWARTDSCLAVGVGGVLSRSELWLVRSNSAEECASHSESDIW